ncbi:TPA: hypothetical protein PXJ84_003318 [Yersinia enterocolitica]|nr:hypothetical protein [Yersinia enterocolitica]
MSEVINSAPEVNSYDELIKEAFINPIRSVTVIDDEYPTLSGYLEPSTLLEKQKSQVNIDRLKEIIKLCYYDRKWSLDVYDGQRPAFGKDSLEYHEHIHHSDLIILDYHLDGEPESDDGERAKNIIKCLANNSHFNLLIVHTKGLEGDIRNIYLDILLKFIKLSREEYEQSEDIKDNIEEYIYVNNMDSVKINIDEFFLFKNLGNEKLIFNLKHPDNPYMSVNDGIKEISDGLAISSQEVIKYLVSNQLNSMNFNTDEYPNVIDWDYVNESVNYLFTGKLFVTVVRKSNDISISDLPQKLLSSLVKHNPSPMLLLMAKIRHELDEKGFEQASLIIGNKCAQAGWLYDLLEKSPTDEAKHYQAIYRHWEQLASASKESLIDFSKRMISSLKAKELNNVALIDSFFSGVRSDRSNVLANLNAYACSRPISTSKLNTGTILTVKNDGAEPEFWICLSPACDLVPEQKSKLWLERIGDQVLPFKAINLINDGSLLSTALSKANGNDYIFIPYEDKIIHLKFSVADNGNPKWDTFYAINQGKFNGDFLNVKALRINSENNELEVKNIVMNALIELRYEYALNFLQKFGSNQSRVGLDYVTNLWQ